MLFWVLKHSFVPPKQHANHFCLHSRPPHTSTRTKTTRKRPPRGVKTTNKNLSLKRFQISVSNRMVLIGRENHDTWCYVGLAWRECWQELNTQFLLDKTGRHHIHDWSIVWINLKKNHHVLNMIGSWEPIICFFKSHHVVWNVHRGIWL